MQKATYNLLVPRDQFDDFLEARKDAHDSFIDTENFREIESCIGSISANFITKLLSNAVTDVATQETASAGSIDVPLITEMGKLYREKYDLAKQSGSEKVMDQCFGAMKVLRQIQGMLEGNK